MYYFVNGRSAEIIEDYIASEGFGISPRNSWSWKASLIPQ